MRKFSKINESKIDIIKEILLEIDLIDGIERYYYGEVNPFTYEVNIFFKEISKISIGYIIDINRIKQLNEIFSTIERLNNVGFETYITYLANNSKQMVFRIEKD